MEEITSPSNDDDHDGQPKFTLFFDLPREVRDMIYLYFPGIAWVDITQTPQKTKQPVTALVCRRMREESLASFYGSNTFLLDMRGWKSRIFPRTLIPPRIFDKWSGAIGEENAGRLRSLSFYSHNFSANVRISDSLQPRITLKFRANANCTAEDNPRYTFQLAKECALDRITRVLDRITAERGAEAFTVADIQAIAHVMERVQPFLCLRMSLGYRGVQFSPRMPNHWPDVTEHLARCDDCGYQRAAT